MKYNAWKMAEDRLLAVFYFLYCVLGIQDVLTFCKFFELCTYYLCTSLYIWYTSTSNLKAFHTIIPGQKCLVTIHLNK